MLINDSGFTAWWDVMMIQQLLIVDVVLQCVLQPEIHLSDASHRVTRSLLPPASPHPEIHETTSIRHHWHLQKENMNGSKVALDLSQSQEGALNHGYLQSYTDHLVYIRGVAVS